MIYSTAVHICATAARRSTLRTLNTLAAMALITVSLSACDRLGDILILPELDVTYSFEGGLDGWVPDALDVTPGTDVWSIGTSGEEVSTGSAAARLSLDNQGGAGKIWLIRSFEVEPGREYQVDVIFDVASADSGDPWRILVSAHTAPPVSASELQVQIPTPDGDEEYAWSEQSFRVAGRADAEGNLYVLVGIWGTTVDARTYYLDNLRLLFTRSDQGDTPAGTVP